MTTDFLESLGNRGFSSSKDIFDLSGILILIGIAFFFAARCEFRVGSFGGGFVEMYCPMVSVFPKLETWVPMDILSIELGLSGIEVEVFDFFKVGDYAAKGILFYLLVVL